MLRLLPLVLGAFAIGAETFMVSGVLPQIAADLGSRRRPPARW